MTVRQIAISLFLLAALGARGATSIRLLKEGDWRKHSGLAVDADGNGALSEGRAETLNAFPMDKSRSYRLSGEFRLAGNANEKARLYFGVEPLDARNRVIQRYHVSPVPGKAMAELAAPLRRNDLFAIVRGAHGWTAKRTYRLALHAKQDKGDLPNFDVTPSFVPNGLEELPDGTVKVTFANPCQVTADAGTAARLHQDGDTYIYAAANRRKPSGEWQTFSGMFSLKGSGMGGCAVHPGTASVKVVFFLTGGDKETKLEFRQIQLEECAEKGLPIPEVAFNPDWNRRPFEIISGELPQPHCPTLLHMEQLDPEQCRVVGNARFSLTTEAVTWRDKAGKLEIPEGEGAYSLFFPKPVEVSRKIDGFELWTKGPASVYVKRFYVEYTDAGGRQGRVTMTGGSNRLYGNVWWQPAIGKLPANAQFPLKVTGLTFVLPPKTRADTIIFDTLGGFQFEKISLPDTSGQPMPFPVTPDSILPGIQGEVCALESRCRNQVCEWHVKAGDDSILYRYEPKTGTLGDIQVIFNGGSPFFPAFNGGPIAKIPEAGGFLPVDIELNNSPETQEKHIRLCPGDPEINAHLLSFQFREGRADTRWRWEKNGRHLEFSLGLYVKNRSLAVEAASEIPFITDFDCGYTQDTPKPRLFSLAYLHNRWGFPSLLATDDYFVSLFPDYHRSNASFLVESFKAFGLPKAEVLGESSARITGGCSYIPKTDGTLNCLGERIYITVSGNLEAVMPNIPNPRSRYFDEMKRRVCTIRMYELKKPEDLPHEIEFWRRMRAYGVTDLFLRYHAGQFRTPFASNRFNHSLTGAQYVGGDFAFQTLVQEMKRLFPRVAPYEDNRFMSALSPDFRYAYISQESSGLFSNAWDRSFKPNPSSQHLLQAEFTPNFIQKYGWNACYLDELSNSPPWAQVDFNADAPGAGMFREVLRNYGYLTLKMKEYYQGPIWSEGNAAYFYAGLMDTDYADSNTAADIPLVDFKLLKFNPLENASGFDKTRIRGNVDELLANEILFGNIGMLHQRHSITSASNISLEQQRVILKSYFMVRQLQEYYCGVKPVAIEYRIDGKYLTATKMLRGGQTNTGLIRIRYENGLVIHVNRSKSDNWPVRVDDAEFLLPPFGYVACLPGKILVYSALVDGERVDYSRGPMYIYADSHGKKTAFPEFTAMHGMLMRYGETPDTATLTPMTFEKAERLTGLVCERAIPCDQDGREIGASLSCGEQGLAIDGNAFLYRLEGVRLPPLSTQAPRVLESTTPQRKPTEKHDTGEWFYEERKP